MGGLRRPIRDRRADRGAAAVEFALVLIPLIVIALGILSYGVMLTFRQNLSQAAAEGARAAAVTVNDDGKLEAAYAAIDEALDASDVDCVAGALKVGNQNAGSCTVTIAECEDTDPAELDNGVAPSCATVVLDYDYANHGKSVDFPGLGILLPDDLTYTSTARVS